MKIFYDPITLVIKGMSEENSLNFPYIETDEKYHSTINMSIKMLDGGPKLFIHTMWEGSETEKQLNTMLKSN